MYEYLSATPYAEKAETVHIFSTSWSNAVHLYSHVKFRHVSVAATPNIREENAADQKTPLIQGVYLITHTSLFRDHIQHTLVDVADINSSLLKGDGKYTDVCLTRQTPFGLWCCLP